MKKHILFINTQAFGDVVLGINAARRYKEDNPDHLVSYAIKHNFQLTTNETDEGIKQVIEVLSYQSWLDAVGIVKINSQGGIDNLSLNNSDVANTPIYKIIGHTNWYSDLNISKSTNFPIKKYISKEQFLDGNTLLEVEDTKKPDILTIGTAGPLDWNRKLQCENTRINFLLSLEKELLSRGLEHNIVMFGVDINNYSLYQSLCLLKTVDLFISPMGSLIHSATALGVDTISIPSVFPASYDSPEYYSKKGWHRTVTHKPQNHCGSYSCVSPKLSTDKNHSFGNPPTEFGFWPKTCKYKDNGLSCTHQTDPEDIIIAVREWLDVRSK